MQNDTPQLPAELEKRFDDKFHCGQVGCNCADGIGSIVAVKHFLATALEEQKKDILHILDMAEVQKWFDMPNSTENWKTWKKIRNTINERDTNAE